MTFLACCAKGRSDVQGEQVTGAAYAALITIPCALSCATSSSPISGGQLTLHLVAKVQQVAPANVKAVLVANSSFQSGALELAGAKGIGLVRAIPNARLKWILHRSLSPVPVAGALQAAQVQQAFSLQGLGRIE